MGVRLVLLGRDRSPGTAAVLNPLASIEALWSIMRTINCMTPEQRRPLRTLRYLKGRLPNANVWVLSAPYSRSTLVDSGGLGEC